MKTALKSGILALAVGGIFASSANASLITYDWEQVLGLGHGTSSGSLKYDTATRTISEFWFSWGTVGDRQYTSSSPLGSASVLPDGHLVLERAIDWVTLSDGTRCSGTWDTENGQLYGNTFTHCEFTAYGSWTWHHDGGGDCRPVPEPSTCLAGALLAIPFGLQGIRYLRNRKP